MIMHNDKFNFYFELPDNYKYMEEPWNFYGEHDSLFSLYYRDHDEYSAEKYERIITFGECFHCLDDNDFDQRISLEIKFLEEKGYQVSEIRTHKYQDQSVRYCAFGMGGIYDGGIAFLPLGNNLLYATIEADEYTDNPYEDLAEYMCMVKKLNVQDKLNIVNVNFDNFKQLFPRMKEEFPESEMKNLEQFKHSMLTGKYCCLTLQQNGIILGMALGCLLKQNGIFWLDYLQIFKENQGRSLGSKLLNMLLFGFDGQDPIAKTGIILEVEKPDNTDFNDNKVSRMRFYDRFNITKIDVDYLFPSNDGGTVPLQLSFLPSKGCKLVSKDVLVDSIKTAVETIHFDVPHALPTMNTYIHKVQDLYPQIFSFEDVDISNPDELITISELIYEVDPWVYPALFDGSIDIARKVGPYLIKSNTIYNYKNIKLGKINGEIAGFIVLLDKYNKENHQAMIDSMIKGNGKLTPKFDHVMEGYFDTLDYEWEGIQILSLSVFKKYRGLHVASKMLDSLDRHQTYSLACVKENMAARRLYEKNGFIYKYDYPGYTGVPCVELVKRGK